MKKIVLLLLVVTFLSVWAFSSIETRKLRNAPDGSLGGANDQDIVSTGVGAVKIPGMETSD
jgi:hypothetical protein